jgi:hypothetical protein
MGRPTTSKYAVQVGVLTLLHAQNDGRRRFDSTKSTELRFRALLTEGDSRVIFHREGFGRLKEDLA